MENRRLSCDRKFRYLKREAADLVLAKMRGQLRCQKRPFATLNVYRCKRCKCFHIGNNPDLVDPAEAMAAENVRRQKDGLVSATRYESEKERRDRVRKETEAHKYLITALARLRLPIKVHYNGLWFGVGAWEQGEEMGFLPAYKTAKEASRAYLRLANAMLK